MVGVTGRSGGARAGAGHPKGVPGGRSEGAHDNSLAPARVVPLAQKWEFAELALRHAEDMLNILVNLAKNAESEAVRAMAADKVIDRAVGKAPAHIDITAMHHTDIVYQSAEELRAELRKAIEADHSADS